MATLSHLPALFLVLLDASFAFLTRSRARRIARIPRGTSDATLRIVVPARDEAANIADCVESALAQRVATRVVVVDDGSTDGTGGIAREAAAGDPRLSVLRLEGPPEGWAGKAHALHCGSQDATEDWLLFLDADCRLGDGAAEAAVALALREGVDMVSMGASLSVPSIAWPTVTPVGLQLILGSYEPDPPAGSDKALAVGHFILVRRAAYEAAGTYAAIRSTRADDVDLASLVCRSGSRTRFAWGGDHLRSAQQATWGELWASWRKSLHAGTQGSAGQLLSGGAFFLAWGAGPFACVAMGLRGKDAVLAGLGAASLAIQVWGKAACDAGMRLPWYWCFAAPVARIALGGMMVDAGLRALAGSASTWKGRSVESQTQTTKQE
ncbi:putative glycosyl transferase [Hyaloraphidium curvatum]|nr:putative glycosyl transferase [Hyaloraphidium curvatum]